MQAAPPLKRLADHLVGGIDGWIAQRRQAGKSWRVISRELSDLTDGEIDVTYETLRSWAAEPTEAAS